MSREPIARYKVVILGDGGVGKTSLTRRYTAGVFEADYKVTIGFQFYVKKIEVEDKPIGLQIWDFAGEAEFRFLLKNVLSGAHGAVFMYDITREKSYIDLDEWLTLYQKILNETDAMVPAILVGSKIDLEDKREVSPEEGKAMAKKWELIDYVECSSKTGKGVENVFDKIARIMMMIDGKLDEY